MKSTSSSRCEDHVSGKKTSAGSSVGSQWWDAEVSESLHLSKLNVSVELTVSTGVPQGSVLGSLEFFVRFQLLRK